MQTPHTGSQGGDPFKHGYLKVAAASLHWYAPGFPLMQPFFFYLRGVTKSKTPIFREGAEVAER